MIKEAEELINNISKVLVGKQEQILLAVITLLSRGHLLIEDVPGVGKTTLAKAMADSIHCSLSRIQFTPDTMPSDITGTSIFNMKTGEFEFRQGAIMNHIILADEINRTSPKTQASLLESMEENQVTVDGHTFRLPEPFMVIATENPIDYLGTYHLPEAQLDRFFIKLSIGYPNQEAEEEMIERRLGKVKINKIAPVMEGTQICQMQQQVSQVKIHKELVSYIINLITETRNQENIKLGASPRATLALVRAAQAKAYIDERDYVIPDDISSMMRPVLEHRMVLTAEAKMNKKEVGKVLDNIISKTKVPNL